jgi:hypothetical protein
MKGYLQRLAATVTTRTPAIHPIVSSVFPAPAAVDSSSISIAAKPSSAAEDTASLSAPTPSTQHEDLRGHLIDNQHSSESVEDSHRSQPIPYHPLLKPSFTDALGDPSHDRSSEAYRTRQQSTSIEADSPAVTDSPLATSSSRRESPASAHPSNPSPQPLLPISPEIQRESRAAHTPGPARPETQPRASHSSRQPEDIQIHIGRIEVLAVPPPVARPAAPPPRKSVSLDEYLRRSERRSR